MLGHMASAEAADWQWSPRLQMGTDYSDNPRLLTSGAESTSGLYADVSTAIARNTERWQWKLQPRWLSSRYSRDSLLDRDDQYLATSLLRVNEKSSWSIDVNLVRDSTLTSELDTTGLVQTNRRHDGATMNGTATLQLTERLSSGVQAAYLDNRYEDAQLTGLVDYNYRTSTLFGAYQSSDLSTWQLQARAGELRAQGRVDESTDADVTLRYQRTLDELWSMTASVGPSWVESDADRTRGEVYSLSFSRRAERWNFSLAGVRELTPTGRGALTQRDRVSLSTRWRLRERLSTSMSLHGIRNVDVVGYFQTPVETQYGHVDVRVDWTVTQSVAVALSLGASTQEREDRPDRASRHSAGVSIVWSPL